MIQSKNPNSMQVALTKMFILPNFSKIDLSVFKCWVSTAHAVRCTQRVIPLVLWTLRTNKIHVDSFGFISQTDINKRMAATGPYKIRLQKKIDVNMDLKMYFT